MPPRFITKPDIEHRRPQQARQCVEGERDPPTELFQQQSRQCRAGGAPPAT
jgi:hypothetical protein